MTFRDTLCAFILGAAAVLLAHTLFADLAAQPRNDEIVDVCVNSENVMRAIGAGATCAAGERPIRLKQPDVDRPCDTERKADVEALQRRIAVLEGRADERLLDRTAIAPFNVVNEAGIDVFSVTAPEVGNASELVTTDIFNETGRRIAMITTNAEGGSVQVHSGVRRDWRDIPEMLSATSATLSAFGTYASFTVRSTTKPTLELGSRSERYGLTVYGASGKEAAGFGESKAGSGIAIVFDATGNPRADLHCYDAKGVGVITIRDAGDKAVAEISAKGNGGSGLLQLNNNAEVVMVEAGVLNTGIGAVRAGPGAFQQGIGFLGLPASYIEGRK